MSHDIQETVLGKRKRREASSAAEKPQARIDHYFATQAPVKKPSNGIGHASVSDETEHMVRVRCDSAAVSQVDPSADTSQAYSAKHQQHSQQASQHLNLTQHEHEEQKNGATDDHVATAHPCLSVQDEHLQKAKSAGATAFKANSKPYSAVPTALQPRHAAPKPTSAATTQPDLAEHLSFFLSVLPERQQFRE